MFKFLTLRTLGDKHRLHRNTLTADPNPNRIGRVRFVKRNLTLRLYYSRGYYYELDLERDTFQEWIRHIQRKRWWRSEMMPDVFEAWERFAPKAPMHAVATNKQQGKRRSIPVSQRWAIFQRDGFKCCVCGSSDILEVDHKTPVARGGGNHIDNLWTLCQRCNRGKRDSLIQTYEQRTIAA
jgi:hypothetical protein